MLIEEAVLITEDMRVLLICNPLQSQDASIQTNVNKSRVVLDNLPNLDSLERRLVTRDQQAIPLIPGSSSSG